MSNDLLQPGVPSQRVSLQTATTIKKRLYSLSVEIKVMILCTLTAAELIDFRCCCTEFNALFIANQSPIIRGVLRNHSYHTASTLFDAVSASGPPSFEQLKPIARRCHNAETVATAIAEHHEGQGLAAMNRMGNNIRPYLLALGHFFEQYRIDLAKSTSDPLFRVEDPSPATSVEGEILRANYNEQTVQRMCLTYELLDKILQHKVNEIIPRVWYSPLYGCLCRGSATTAPILTFGGLEMIKDIMTHSKYNGQCKDIVSHFFKTLGASVPEETGHSLALALPSSILGPRLSEDTKSKICGLLTHSRHVLSLTNIKIFGFANVDSEEELKLKREFLEYLVSYEGDEPKLEL